jgi:hypothetical protein
VGVLIRDQGVVALQRGKDQPTSIFFVGALHNIQKTFHQKLNVMGRQDTKKLTLTNYPTFYLSDEEVIDPFSVFKDFFSFAHLPEVREMLWLSLKTTVTGSFPQGEALNPRDRLYIILLYEQLQRLVEAVHLLNEMEKSESAT